MNSLRNLLRLNAASCLLFGGIFAVFPAATADFLGDPPEGAVMLVGIALLFNAAHLLLASVRKALLPIEIIWFSAGDLLWWSATLALLATMQWVTTLAGIALASLVATGVAAMGLAQMWEQGRMSVALSHGAFARQIVTSWLALPPWVKIWLFALNAVFLLVAFLMPSETTRIVLIAFVASGPLLLAFAFIQGGLSRLMGIGHLIPWLPLLGWLLVCLWRGEWSAPQSTYATLLAIAIAICLAFDVYDVHRWIRGQKDLLGARHSGSEHKA